MLWQLIPTESGDLLPIDLKDGAHLLGKSQRASPDINSDSVAKIAARIHAKADRVQLTAMAVHLRVWRNDQPQLLGRGQSVLLTTGDLLDLGSNADVAAPAGEFTYMLAESLLEETPLVSAATAVPQLKVEPAAEVPSVVTAFVPEVKIEPDAAPVLSALASQTTRPVSPPAAMQRQTPSSQLPTACEMAASLAPLCEPLAGSGAHSLQTNAAVPQQVGQAASKFQPLCSKLPSSSRMQPPLQVSAIQADNTDIDMLKPSNRDEQQSDQQAARHASPTSAMYSLPSAGDHEAVAQPGVNHFSQHAKHQVSAASQHPSNGQEAAHAAWTAAEAGQQALDGASIHVSTSDSNTAAAAYRAALGLYRRTSGADQQQPEQPAAADIAPVTADTVSDNAAASPAAATAANVDIDMQDSRTANPVGAATDETAPVNDSKADAIQQGPEHSAAEASEEAAADKAAIAHSAAATEQAQPAIPQDKRPSPQDKRHGSKSAADIFDTTMTDCKKLLAQTRSVLLKEPTGLSEAPSSRIAAAERALTWHKELEGLMRQCKQPQLYIGVLGDTGAGKSSTINCLLEEESIVPVNGMRACTACVVEISYIPSSMYEGTVECMTRAEWEGQAKALWADLLDERGRLRICRDAERRLNTNSIEGAAQATLETVYGAATLRRSGITLEKLFSINNRITNLLGRTINIREPAAKHFRKRIGEYVDSHNKKDEVQAWPLVKVCKLRHNWKVLSTGAVLVDLPGVRDANAARGAIAEKYMKSCNAVWIVADITRAVDNRTAKDLLGENFRRQMLMDGQYGSISFICTKTDMIQVSETVRAFSGCAEMCELAGVPVEKYAAAQERVDERQSEVNKLERTVKRCKREAKRLTPKIAGMRKRLTNIDKKVASLQSGGTAAAAEQAEPQGVADWSESDSAISGESESDAEYAPGDKRARKTHKSSSSHKKCRRKSDSDSDLEIPGFSNEDDAGDSGSDASDSDDEKMAESPIRKKPLPGNVESLQKEAAELTYDLNKKVEKVRVLKKEQSEAQALQDKAERKLGQAQLVVRDICARARNAYSKRSLKKDFKDGLTEMEETAAFVELDAIEGATSTAEPVLPGKGKGQDADLPVFCVSAKDCQRYEGRTSKDGPPSAFIRLEHTEIPQLRAHVHHVTEQGRLHAARSLASGLSQFINTTATTLVHHGTIQLELQEACKAAFDRELAKLLESTTAVLQSWRRTLEHDCTRGSISTRLDFGVEVAENKAVATSDKWSAHRLEGGLVWATYKATVRPARNGVYKSGARGEINFNADLARPILDGISMQWETLFGTTIIERLKQYRTDVAKKMVMFLSAVKASLTGLGVDANRLTRITTEAQAHEAKKSSELIGATSEEIQARQRDMSREVIEPTVQTAMTDAYAACCAECGPGQFQRMRVLMKAAVNQQKESMFQEAAQKLELAMKEMVAGVAKGLEKGQQRMGKRVADMFTILWETPSCSKEERKTALIGLQELSVQMQSVCVEAGALKLVLTLPEEEEERPDQPKQPEHPQKQGNTATLAASQTSPDKTLLQLEQEAKQLQQQLMTECSMRKQAQLKLQLQQNASAQKQTRLLHDQQQRKRQLDIASARSHHAACMSSVTHFQQVIERMHANVHESQNATARARLLRRKEGVVAVLAQAELRAQQAQTDLQQLQQQHLEMQENQPPNAAPMFQHAIEPAHHQLHDCAGTQEDEEEEGEEDSDDDIPEEDRQALWHQQRCPYDDQEEDEDEMEEEDADDDGQEDAEADDDDDEADADEADDDAEVQPDAIPLYVWHPRRAPDQRQLTHHFHNDMQEEEQDEPEDGNEEFDGDDEECSDQQVDENEEEVDEDDEGGEALDAEDWSGDRPERGFYKMNAVPAVTAEVSEMDADQPESGESESDEAEAEESDDPAGAEGVVVAGTSAPQSNLMLDPSETPVEPTPMIPTTSASRAPIAELESTQQYQPAPDAPSATSPQAVPAEAATGAAAQSLPCGPHDESMKELQSTNSADAASSNTDDSLLATAPTQQEGTPVASEPDDHEAHSTAQGVQPLQLQLDQSASTSAPDLGVQQADTVMAEAADHLHVAVPASAAADIDRSHDLASVPECMSAAIDSLDSQTRTSTADIGTTEPADGAVPMDTAHEPSTTDIQTATTASESAALPGVVAAPADTAQADKDAAAAGGVDIHGTADKYDCPWKALAASAKEAEDFATRVLTSPDKSAAAQKEQITPAEPQTSTAAQELVQRPAEDALPAIPDKVVADHAPALSTPASETPAAASKLQGKPTRPSLERCKRVTPGISKAAPGSSKTTPSSSKMPSPVSSTPLATVDLSGFSPRKMCTTGSKARWLGKAGNILQRWTVPAKVKKEKQDSKRVSQENQGEVIVIE